MVHPCWKCLELPLEGSPHCYFCGNDYYKAWESLRIGSSRLPVGRLILPVSFVFAALIGLSGLVLAIVAGLPAGIVLFGAVTVFYLFRAGQALQDLYRGPALYAGSVSRIRRRRLWEVFYYPKVSLVTIDERDFGIDAEAVDVLEEGDAVIVLFYPVIGNIDLVFKARATQGRGV